jgi:hypothetical protein
MSRVLVTVVLPAAIALSLVGGMLLVWSWLAVRRKRPLLLCPGRVIPWWLWLLWPPKWLLWSRCGYDLSACRVAADGVITCPECGRMLPRRHRRLPRSRHRWRNGRFGFMLLTIGLAAVTVIAVRERMWASGMPTTCLIGLEWIAGPNAPEDAGRTLNLRASRGDVANWQLHSVLRLLMRDLKDDGVANNADEAMEWLRHYGKHVIPHAEAALESSDWQQRQLSACLLRGLSDYPATAALLRATLEDPPGGGSLQFMVSHGMYRWELDQYLVRHMNEAEPIVREVMRQGSDTMQWICARASLRDGRRSLMADAAPIIIRHLRDNDVRFDAGGAMSALRVCGPKIAPLLQPSLQSYDMQERQIAASVLRSFKDLPVTHELLAATVDGLKRDRLPYDPRTGRSAWVRNASEGVRFLVEHCDDAEDLLREAIRKGDRAQRFYCSCIAGFAQRRSLMHAAVPVLVDHLRDNNIDNDGTWALRALWGFGPEVVPLLERWADPEDQQQCESIAFLLERFGLQAAGLNASHAQTTQDLTNTTHDPTQADWRDLRMPDMDFY